MRILFHSSAFQYFSALLIILVTAPAFPDSISVDRGRSQNFLASIFEAQYGRKLVLQDGSATRLGEMMDALNLFFTAYFAVELCINAFANWFSAFAYNGWNHLDVFIVLMSLIDLGPLDIPDWLVQLMRALRVIRLFGRIHALKKMTAAVTASLFPMMNAFIILLIVLSICASLPAASGGKPVR